MLQVKSKSVSERREMKRESVSLSEIMSEQRASQVRKEEAEVASEAMLEYLPSEVLMESLMLAQMYAETANAQRAKEDHLLALQLQVREREEREREQKEREEREPDWIHSNTTESLGVGVLRRQTNTSGKTGEFSKVTLARTQTQTQRHTESHSIPVPNSNSNSERSGVRVGLGKIREKSGVNESQTESQSQSETGKRKKRRRRRGKRAKRGEGKKKEKSEDQTERVSESESVKERRKEKRSEKNERSKHDLQEWSAKHIRRLNELSAMGSQLMDQNELRIGNQAYNSFRNTLNKKGLSH